MDLLSLEQLVRWTEDLSKAKEEDNYRFTTTELLFRTIFSVNQLSVHGAQQLSDHSIFQHKMKDEPEPRNLTQRIVNLSEATFDQRSRQQIRKTSRGHSSESVKQAKMLD